MNAHFVKDSRNILNMKSHRRYNSCLLLLRFCHIATDMLLSTIIFFFYLHLSRFKAHLTVNFNCVHSEKSGLEDFSSLWTAYFLHSFFLWTGNAELAQSTSFPAFSALFVY